MKFLLACIAALFFLNAQSQTSAQSVQSIRTTYVPDQSDTLTQQPVSPMDLRMFPLVEVTLNPNVSVSKIYLAMKSSSDSSNAYSTFYSMSPVSQYTDGKELFHYVNNTVMIRVPVSVPLKPYLIQVYTEDSAGSASAVFSVTQ